MEHKLLVIGHFVEPMLGKKRRELTLPAERHVHVVNLAILTKDLAQVILSNVLGKSLDHNLFVKSVSKAFVVARKQTHGREANLGAPQRAFAARPPTTASRAWASAEIPCQASATASTVTGTAVATNRRARVLGGGPTARRGSGSTSGPRVVRRTAARA